ncbi:Aminotransferase-like plant mobile domain family protein [Euphorbia peplus]|nr:Aminotransferase-like plant mobile domain family protein [Euphorbia peplus]
MEEEPSSSPSSSAAANSIVESKPEEEELKMSPSNPKPKTPHFLKPSLDSNSEKSSNLSLPSSFPLKPTFDPQNWPFTVNFLGWKNPPTNWKEWVHQMASLHAPTWKRAGIYDAILNSTYRFDKHDELLLSVAERWCPDTNSFVFPWGEATVTLEDMLVAGFPVLGSPVFRPLLPEESGDILEALIMEKREMNRTPAKKALQSSWLKIFMDSGSQIEHEAFLSLWLSRFVFPTSRDVICECVFSIAIHLARGTRIALAPAVLATIYRDLSLLKEKMVALTTLDAGEKLVAITYAPFRLVLVWMWERFVQLSPKPNPLKVGEPRFARWNCVKCNVKDVRQLFDSSKGNFIWRPYAKPVENWDMPKFYSEKEMWVNSDSFVHEDVLSFIMCLRVSQLVGLESGCIEQYLPQRVARQFGFDQDVPGFVDQCNSTHEDAWGCYIRPITGTEWYIPSCLFEGEVTTRYVEWWNHAVSLQHQEKTSETTPKLPREKGKGQETSSSSPISSKSLQRKRAAGALTVSKVSAKAKRTKEGESSRSPIGKTAAGKLNRLEVSAKVAERMKKDEVSNSAIRKKPERNLKGLKGSTESMKKCGTSKSPTRKKSAGELDGLKVLTISPESMKEGGTISSFKGRPKTTKEMINGEASVARHVNRAKRSEISVESSKVMNKESNKPAISLVVEINEFPVPPGFAAENITVITDDSDSMSDITVSDLSSPTDDESLKGFHEEKLKPSEAECESKLTRGNGNVSDQSHLSANERSPNVLGTVASKEKVKHSTASGSVVDTRDKAVAQLGGFHGRAESESLKFLGSAAPVVETVMLFGKTTYLENVDHGGSVLSENNKALGQLSKEDEGQNNDIENGRGPFDQSESHLVAGNETRDVPEKVMLTETASLMDSDSSKGNGKEGSNGYSSDAPKPMLDEQIEKLGKIMAARFRDVCGGE